MIMNQCNKILHYNFDVLNNLNNHRIEYIKGLIDQQSKMIETQTKDETNNNKDVIVAIHPKWISQYINCMPVIEESDKKYLIDVRVSNYFNHRIFVLESDASPEKMNIEYICLCWLREFNLTICEDIGRDIIISSNTFRYFLSMLIGLDFHNLLLKNKTMMDYYPDYNIRTITVLNKEFGKIKYPSKEDFANIKEYIDHYAFWSQLY
jgi:hypothetical protein